MRTHLTPDDDEARPYFVPVFEADVLPGVDIARLNQLAGDLEDDVSTEQLGS